MYTFRATVLAIAGLVCIAAPAAAQPLITDPGTGTLRTYGGFTFGTTFVVGSSPETLGGLGVWTGSNTLSADAMVALWIRGTSSSNGTLVASATIPAGTGSNVGQFDYRFISPVLLLANTRYDLGAYFPGSDTTDMTHDVSSTPTTDPAFNGFVGTFSSTNNAGTITDPFGGAGGVAYVGPNLIYGVPEPSSLLLGLGAAGMISARRRQRST